MRQRYEALRFEITHHGQTIEGWRLENTGARSDVVILYFGGNAEDVLYTAGSMEKLDAHVMLISNYRGYGRSTGKATERALYEDGLALYEYALRKGARADRDQRSSTSPWCQSIGTRARLRTCKLSEHLQDAPVVETQLPHADLLRCRV